MPSGDIFQARLWLQDQLGSVCFSRTTRIFDFAQDKMQRTCQPWLLLVLLRWRLPGIFWARRTRPRASMGATATCACPGCKSTASTRFTAPSAHHWRRSTQSCISQSLSRCTVQTALHIATACAAFALPQSNGRSGSSKSKLHIVQDHQCGSGSATTQWKPGIVFNNLH